MSMTAMNRAMNRGIRRGIRMQSGDLTSIRKMRAEIEQADYVAEAWNEVGKSMREAMNSLEPSSRPSSQTPTRKR